MKNLNTGFVFLGSLMPIPAAKEFNFHLPYRKFLCLRILESYEWSHLELDTSLWVASPLPLYHQSRVQPALVGVCCHHPQNTGIPASVQPHLTMSLNVKHIP